VPDRVEALPLGEQERRVELGVEDPLFPMEGAGEVGAARREDRATAAAKPLDAFEL
jgi:hypothetical protein